MFPVNQLSQNSPYYQGTNMSLAQARNTINSSYSNSSTNNNNNNMYKRDRSSSNNAVKRPPMPAAQTLIAQPQPHHGNVIPTRISTLESHIPTSNSIIHEMHIQRGMQDVK